MACEIEVIDPETFMWACLGLRWSYATGLNADTLEGMLYGKWVRLAISQKQYDFKEVDPYAQ